jgi:two-component system, sensor histidine kinase and response regulator
MTINPPKIHRILVIDDNGAIQDDIRRILISSSNCSNDWAEEEAAPFAISTEEHQLPVFEIDLTYQGLEGLERIEKSLLEDRPYAMAFVDVRTPPGWDGVETTCKIWEKCHDLQVVLCTAYSDYSWAEMLKRLGYSNRLVILKKPFNPFEVWQLAIAMSQKWRLYQQAKHHLNDLKRVDQERALALKAANFDIRAAQLILVTATEQALRMADTALAAVDPKSGFLTTMSHEIRTPMNGVIGLIHLLIGTNQTAEQRGFAQTILESANALLGVINDILVFSRIEPGKMTLEEIERNQ